MVAQRRRCVAIAGLCDRNSKRRILEYVIGLLLVALFGVQLIGLINIPWPQLRKATGR